MKHTPGPWEVEEFNGSGKVDFHVVKRTGQHWEPLASTWGGPHEGNARLIAASPDLYDACNAMIGLVQLLPPKVRAALESNHRFREAQAAVARADGAVA